ncbi:MAG: YceI family protein [Pseudomonadota bacterium]
MARVNTPTSYGSVTKSFHWLTAFLILSMIPLGVIANDLAYQIKDPQIPSTGEDIARVAWLFSLHKTVGVALFFTALARIAWAISQPKPGLLNGDKPLEAMAATTVHWVLYSSLVLVPLSGWIHHASTTGFAPIWWRFGDSLPFVPKDEVLADQTATLHWLACIVLVGALVLHIAGAIKHHVIDKDATLRRMLPGSVSAEPTTRQPGEVLPIGAALTVWIAVIFVGVALTATEPKAEAQTASLEAVESDWTVTDGALDVSITLFGSEVQGNFADWTAAIDYVETPNATGKHGTVEVIVNTDTLTVGSVSNDAKGAAYFDVANHPTARFEADIMAVEGGLAAVGQLTIKDQSRPVTLPFDLSLDGDTAQASGEVTLDRREFNIGAGTVSGTDLGYEVAITFTLTAQRGDAETEEVAPTDATASDLPENAWLVDSGALSLAINQFGSDVTGVFEDWTADITYADTPDASGKQGHVTVTINIASLSLGSVTDQAKGADYFDVQDFPTATFDADIINGESGHMAEGTLTIKDQTVPVTMPFDLVINDATAQASGALELDRRDFGIGMGTTDEATLGFAVRVDFTLTASQPGS